MRSRVLILPASLLLLASSAGAQTQAQTQDYPLTTPETMLRVEVMAETPAFTFRDYEAEAISGAYAMSNGWRMKVDPSADGIVAQIDKQPPIRLVALSRDRYATRDGNVAMEFNRGALGDEMLMSYVPGSRTAQMVVITTARLAQR
ncbi:hypothetical protein SRABI118_00388 [Massilia sp. Bi118]|uniref:hypothetical protein n=1 Tax=Massilia sp. Bi118 TaxID=2822346 RepID=UPI001DDFC38C|nr:hypothetical protein [Massilia sp. Bi118]CAH0145261.1 hypothetical protein SRABI118_00388 [Massilia sp. Bi118]